MKSYSKYFAIYNQLEKQTIPAELKLCQLEEIIIIQVRGERVLSESGLERERERESDQKEQEEKCEERVEKLKHERELERTLK